MTTEIVFMSRLVDHLERHASGEATMRILVGGYFSKKSGKTTFCRSLFKTFHDQSISVKYYKPVSGMHCWHDFEFVKKTVLRGHLVSQDAVTVLSSVYDSLSEVFSLAREANHTHVLFSRLDLSNPSTVELLSRYDDVLELEQELGAVIDSIPLLARYDDKILMNQWWWKHPHQVVLGKKLRDLITNQVIPPDKITFVDPKMLSAFLFWNPRKFISKVNSEKPKNLVQVIELHDDDVLSGLAEFDFDYFVLVAGETAFLASRDDWKKVIDPIKSLALSYPASKLFPKIKWKCRANGAEIIQKLLDFLE